MEKQEYEECKKRNEKLIQLFETHGLPYYNAFAFADAFCKRKNELRKSPDFLILLATLWSPNNHLFARPVDVENILLSNSQCSARFIQPIFSYKGM